VVDIKRETRDEISGRAEMRTIRIITGAEKKGTRFATTTL